MKKYLVGFYYSLPVQLFLLHFRRYQIILIFWYVLFATVDGTFLKAYGAYSLYLAPEYLDKVNALSAGMVGCSIGIFFMSWNITTFILHSRHLKFLATTANPFLKFCINNAIIPLVFLLFYLFKAINFNRYQQLASTTEIIWLIIGFLLGLSLTILIAFLYFFGADKSIYKRVGFVIDTANMSYAIASTNNPLPREKGDMRIDWFLTADLSLRKPRDVRHYSHAFLDSIFKRHHLAAFISIFLAIIFLLTMGFFLDNRIFQVPAGASSTIFFAIVLAAVGACSFFMGNWSMIFLVLLYVSVNWLVQHDYIDTSNKAYGLNYTLPDMRPIYTKESLLQLATDSNALTDKNAFIQTLNKWKAKQATDKPVMYFINVSGGGNRSATFTFNVLQYLDSITQGNLMKQTVLINGASGGMLGAAYFRELYYRRLSDKTIALQHAHYADNISKDLLNPLFSSFVARDITAPAQRFTVGNYSYVKDRGYSFEKKLSDNTEGVLDKKLKDYLQPEKDALIPFMFFNSVITRDSRRLLISTMPARFMMKAHLDSLVNVADDADVIDYVSFFKNLDPYNLRILSALRMNATFPYVLPNVWLPTKPVIDVMDAGLRDNYGLENTLRFMSVFKDWIDANTAKVVIIQIRDRKMADWGEPEENVSVLSWLTKPMLLLQNNWFKLQDYFQTNELSYVAASSDNKINRILFQYIPAKKDGSASLSFHLTNVEKKDIAITLKDSANQKSFAELLRLSQPLPAPAVP